MKLSGADADRPTKQLGVGPAHNLVKWLHVARSFTLALVLAVLVQHCSTRPNLRTIDPNESGRMEWGMWRSYHEGQWIRLGFQAMQLACGQYGFSWWDGFADVCSCCHCSNVFPQTHRKTLDVSRNWCAT